MPLLWRFNLHYFDYLHLLASHEQVALCREWAADNPVGEGDLFVGRKEMQVVEVVEIEAP